MHTPSPNVPVVTLTTDEMRDKIAKHKTRNKGFDCHAFDVNNTKHGMSWNKLLSEQCNGIPLYLITCRKF